MEENKRENSEGQCGTGEYYQTVLGSSADSLIGGDDKTTKEKLSREAERLSRLVAEDISNTSISDTCSKLLDEARTLLNTDRPDSGAVLSRFDKVKQRLLRAYESRAAWPKWFWILLGFTFFYFLIIIGIIIWQKLIPGQTSLENTAYVCLACALWGGFGGVVDAFFALHTHFSDQDFDKQYRPWYFLHPLLGLSLGAVVFLVLQAGLLAVSNTTLKEVKDGTIGVSALPIALAFLAGLKQNAAFEFLGRIVKSVFQKE